MNNAKSLAFGLCACCVAWAMQVFYLWSNNQESPSIIRATETKARNNMMIAHQEAMRNVENEYAAKMHQATGATVFDRIFNTQEQTITDLISRLAEEALPHNWSIAVKTEEFVHFVLLVYLPPSGNAHSIDSIIRFLHPVVEHTEWFLFNVAIFDYRHKSYLFLDKEMLSHIQKNVALTPEMLALATSRGEAFTRFNSVTIEGEMHGFHLILPMEVTGPNDTVILSALLDTGATTTMLAEKIIRETGTDDLFRAPRRTFQTVNGMITCPIVTREINIGGVMKNIEIAVNQQDDLNLIGMNFFEGMDYVIDSTHAAVHMWEK